MKKITIALVILLLCPLVSFPQSTCDEEPYIVVEQMPRFPGGEEKLITFIQSNAVYPQFARESEIEGKVFVQLVVCADGSVQHVEIVKGVDQLLDAEALRVIELLPDFQPGKQDGKAVPVRMIIPVSFVLNGDKKVKKENDH